MISSFALTLFHLRPSANLIHYSSHYRGYRPTSTESTRMWVNAQRDGRPAEHRWRPLFNDANFG